MNLSTVIAYSKPSESEVKSPRPDAVGVYDLHVLISRIAVDETRARTANLPLPERRAATVREALQLVIDDARKLIHDSLSRDNHIPWIDPPALPEDSESRFVVPLTIG